ncbi:MAG TPA: M48 family metallopeptidase [Symbiobacteriaceae bacterium]|nr:M48 family metallopeptidase [Symbiobacteriaceae bacterium]
MDWLRHVGLKWLMAVLYFALIFGLILLFPVWARVILLVVYVLSALWSLLVLDAQVSREYDLRPLTRWDVPEYDRFRSWLRQAAADAGLRREPHYAVMEDEVPNAMAFGGTRGIVVFTTGILRTLTPTELAAVAGHELKHLSSRDSLPAILGGVWLQIVGYIAALFQRIARTSGGLVGAVAVVIGAVLEFALWVVAWLASITMAQRSRYDELQADLTGARLTSGGAMISALQKLERRSKEFHRQERLAKWSAAWISERMHASHPPMETRVQALRAAAERGEIDVM